MKLRRTAAAPGWTRARGRVCVCLAALACLRALPAGAADIRPLLREAQKQYADQRYEQALRLYREASDAAGGDDAVDYNIGLCHLNLGDGEKAIRQFEAVASRAEARPSVRRDSFYNIGVVRATAARERLEKLLAPATQPSDRKPAPEAPETIEELQAIAAELLRGIAAFGQCERIEPDADAARNIRAARILRRNVLGLLKKAGEQKARKDMLDDPRAFLDALILEQNRQAGITRLFAMKPPEEPAAVRHARRAAIRLQRQTMEQTGTFADHLSQFRETAQKPGAATAPAASQPAQETPRERLYRAAAARLKPPATDAMRDACAFLLDGQIESAYQQQRKAVEAMREAAIFPIEPAQALARWKGEEAALARLVGDVENADHWLRDPLLGDVAVPEGAKWEPKDTAVYDMQDQIGKGLARLAQQCRAVAAASRPADGPAEQQQADPALDPKLNARLAELLDGAAGPQEECLAAIVERNKAATLASQKRIAEIIDAALDLFPKSIEQRLAELIVRQSRLNGEVQAEAGDAKPDAGNAAGSLLSKVRDLTAKLKAAVFRTKPADAAKRFGEQQRGIEKETAAVGEEVRKKIPTQGAAQPGAAPATQGARQEVQPYIEAGKHIEKAGFEMLAAIEGLDKAVVEDSLRPLKSQGPVQTAQANALEELKKALAALQPPQNQPQKQDEQKQDQQQKQQQQERQDVRREVDRQDKEREEAMRQLYKVPPRQVIKDW